LVQNRLTSISPSFDANIQSHPTAKPAPVPLFANTCSDGAPISDSNSHLRLKRTCFPGFRGSSRHVDRGSSPTDCPLGWQLTPVPYLGDGPRTAAEQDLYYHGATPQAHQIGHELLTRSRTLSSVGMNTPDQSSVLCQLDPHAVIPYHVGLALIPQSSQRPSWFSLPPPPYDACPNGSSLTQSLPDFDGRLNPTARVPNLR
jgi:hypothetical protein